MAQRRMFSQKIVGSDAFIEMPVSARELYFQLGMYSDDDGFINPKKIIRMVSASDDDLKVLIGKRFVLPFENGVVVIKHWQINNLIRKDFYQPTIYVEQKETLMLKENKAYTDNVNKLLTNCNHRIDKDRLGKDSILLESTPTQIANNFFTNSDEQDLIANQIAERYKTTPLAIKNEIVKFVFYWTEPNKTGTKQRWQMEKTFEVSRRLATWFSRSNQFNQSNNLITKVNL